MSIFPRLLAVLVTLTVVPLAIVTITDLRAIRTFGQEAASNARHAIVDNSVEELRRTLHSDALTLGRRRAVLSRIVLSQANEVEQRLGRPPSTPRAVYWPEDFDAGRVPGHRDTPGAPSDGGEIVRAVARDQVLALARGVSREEVAADIAALADMADVYRLLGESGHDGIVRQYTALESGLHSHYPGQGSEGLVDPRQRPWYAAARAAGDLVWSYAHNASGRFVATVCVPVKKPDGTFGGVTGLDVALDALVEAMDVPRRWPRGASLFLLGAWEAGGGVDVMARMQGVRWMKLGTGEWDAQDREGLEKLRGELAPGRSGWRTMRWPDEGAVWVYATAGPGGLSLLGILPSDAAAAQVRGVDEETLARMRAVVLRNGLIAAAVLLAAFVAAVLGARFITRPLRALTDMAKGLAAGRFDARVKEPRPPEMGKLADHFNEMGPKLRDLERMGHSLHLAMLIQQSLLPQSPPRLEGFDIAGRIAYCDETGGDYFDYIESAPPGSSRLGIAIGDVVGHGVAAALLMATARGILRSLAAIDLPPAEIVTRLNRVFLNDVPDYRFMTLLYLVLDSRDRSLRLVRAGHDPAVIYDPRGDRLTEVGGPSDIALGIEAQWVYREADQVSLAPEQTLVAGTDGIWECRNPAGEQFGKERYFDVIRRHASRPADEIAVAILDAVDAHRGARRRDDDATVIVVRSLRR